jgi:cell wall-associated NlpC family hydrolase
VTRRRKTIFAIAAGILAIAAPAAIVASGGGEAAPATAERPKDVVLDPAAVDRKAAEANAETADPESKPKVVELRGAGAKPKFSASGSQKDGPSPGAPSDADVKADLKEARAELAKFKAYLGTTAFLQTGPRARVLKDGTAVAPEDAPEPVQRIIQAGNAIAKFPYKWGGGHGAWRDDGYDCSGSVSFALAAAGLMEAPLASGGFINWGEPGPGEWVTIYTNPGHMFMVVAGLRFDTSGRGRDGTRWQEAPRGTGGFTVRHPPGF